MPKKGPSYYLEKADYLGWGKDWLDNQRLELINKYLVGKKILDVGCGKGFYVDFLTKKGVDVTGVDFVAKFIREAKKLKQGRFIKADAQKLPFKDNEFDTVLLFDILEHGDDRLLLKESARVVKSKILVIVPRKVDRQLEQSGVIFRHYLDKSHLREYLESDFKGLAKECGLMVDTILPVHPLYNGTIFSALFGGSNILKKLVRKLVLLLLPKIDYPTEIFVVFNKR